MTSQKPPFRQRKPDPIDTMLDEWQQIRAGERAPPEKERNALPVLAQLELMILLLKRP